jgi:hypothetical protein
MHREEIKQSVSRPNHDFQQDQVIKMQQELMRVIKEQSQSH